MLLTNLLNKSSFPKEEIIELYFRRWAIEDHYRSEKVVLEIEKFHGKTPNSIRQELFAVVIMSVIARTLMVVTSRVHGPRGAEFQFKNAIMTLAAEAAILVPDDPERSCRDLFRDPSSDLTRQILPAKITQTRTAPSHQKTSQQMVRREAGETQKCLSQQH